MTDHQYQYELVSTCDSSLQNYVGILQSVFPKNIKFNFEYLKWLYHYNPFGKIVGFNALYNNKIVAHYVTTPITAYYYGAEVKGLLSLNTATLPEHQGKGLFTKLANLTYEHGYEAGFKFVCGVANANSTPGFLKKLGFNLIAPLNTKIGFGKVDILSNDVNFSFKRLWTQETLEWRLNNPSFDYWKEKNIILVKSKYPATNAILGIDQNYPDNFIRNGSSFFERNKPRIYIGINDTIRWGRNFYDIPSRLRPVPLNFIFKDLQGINNFIKKEELLFQSIDFDIL